MLFVVKRDRREGSEDLPVVRTENLYKVFGRRARDAVNMLKNGADPSDLDIPGVTAAVIDASFEVGEGEIFVVMGLSGSGKSTLIRMLNGILPATSGQVYVNGEDITTMSPKQIRDMRQRTMSMVFQHFALFPHRTVLDNAAYGLRVKGVEKAERLNKAREALELVGLAGWEDHLPEQLSGGMRQRVGLARALAADTDILLMDEAFSALDPLIRREMQDELSELQARMRKTVVFVTHDLDEALRLGDRVAIMKDARVVQVGTPEELITAPADDYVAAFVEGVDKTGVLTAGSIMQPVKEVARLSDGPQTALNRMRRSGLSGILVVDGERRIRGYVTSERIVSALREGSVGSERIHGDLMEPAPTVSVDTPLHEVIAIASEGSRPIAVVDASGRLRGVVVKGAILAALARPAREATGAEVSGGAPLRTVDVRPSLGADGA